MLNKLLVFVLIAHFNVVLAQDNSGKPVSISGEIIGKTLDNDSIHFNTARMYKKY